MKGQQHETKQTESLEHISHSWNSILRRRSLHRQYHIHMGGNCIHRHLARPWRTVDETEKKITYQPKENQMETKTALESKLVQEFVGVAHTDLERTKELLAQEPALVNAAWDWGGGDFETALGAAAHMGNAPIANFLLEHGARLDLFAAAMLGKLEIVTAALEAYPNAINIPGPHGIPLIKHAEMGGDDAKQVLEYLKSRK